MQREIASGKSVDFLDVLKIFDFHNKSAFAYKLHKLIANGRD